MKLNSYKITTPYNVYYVTAWTLAGAILNFSKRDDLFTEVSEADKEYFNAEPIPDEEMESIRIEGNLLRSIIDVFISFGIETIVRKENEEDVKAIDAAYESWG